MSSQAVLSPDSILIEGPITLINAISNPVQLKLLQRNIDEDFGDDVEVKFLNEELIKRNPPTVSVQFKVDRLVQITDSVNLKIVNATMSSRPYIEMQQWLCVYAIPQRMMNQYQADSVYAIVDLKGFKRGEIKVLPVLHGLPPFTKTLKADSVLVKF